VPCRSPVRASRIFLPTALLVGPPGCGKTLVAERFPDLLPNLTRDESLEVARLRSAAGLRVDGLPRRRPFRAPSCGASAAGILGGGRPPGPGEVSLAHRGVLFLDETPHFRGDVLEGLRGPLEDGRVTLSRAGAHLTLPARFLLIAAMNPCPCGHAGTSRCSCTPLAQQRYVRRLSGPLLDRIDLRVMVPAVPFEKLRSKSAGQGTAEMRARVTVARDIQSERLGAGRLNASLTTDEIERHCRPASIAEQELAEACDSGRLSARCVVRVLRVARTLADLKGETGPELRAEHVRTASGWRVDRKG
jgi:magnesium chelatase family protein